MKTWVKWFLSVILTLIVLAFVGGLTYLIASFAEGHEISETARTVISIIGLSFVIGLVSTFIVSSFKEMFDSIERKKRTR